MSGKSTQIALGGVFSALCLLLMFMTGLIPFSSYALPAIAGAMLVVVAVENGTRTAVLIYVTVSILSLFIAPERDAAIMFIAFFGYYPVAKWKLDKIHPGCLRRLVKFVIFNVAVVAGYIAGIYVLGVNEAVEEMSPVWGLALWALANVIFPIYDFALARYYQVYARWFRPKFLRR